MAVGYRWLNKPIEFLVYPKPRIQELLRNVKNTQFRITLDLKNGYFLIPIRDVDIPNTAFVPISEVYAFKRKLFGLSEANATFQKLIEFVLSTVFNAFLQIYLDNTIVTLVSYDDHIQHLKLVFELLQEACLTVEISKCQFWKKNNPVSQLSTYS